MTYYVSAMLAVFVMVFLIMLLGKAGTAIPVFVWVIVFFIAWVLIYVFWVNHQSKRKKESDAVAELKASEKTLILRERSIRAERNLDVKRFVYEWNSYKPAELVYTGVTIGGVSVGSTHVNEAHYESSGKKTDKYLLVYKHDGGHYTILEKIVCSFEIPKNAPVAKFCLDNHTILLKKKGKDKISEYEKDAYARAIQSGDKTRESFIIGQHLEEQLLSKKDIDLIKAWIGGRC